MSKYLTNKILFITALMISVLLVVFTERSFLWLHNGFLNQYENAFLQPLFYWFLGFTFCATLFIFSSQLIFQKWFKKIFVWFVPLGLLITFSTDVYGGIPQPGRTDTAGLLTTLFVGITVIFILVQRFFYKVK